MSAARYSSRRSGYCIPRIAAFSLLEVLIVVAIIAVIGTLTVPSFSRYFNSEKIESATRQLANAIVTSRSSALMFGSSVLLCASADGESCSNDWSKGWLVFHDTDQSLEPGADESILQRYSNKDENLRISVASSAGDNKGYLQFNYRGFLDSPTDAVISRGGTEQTLSVSIFGKPRIL